MFFTLTGTGFLVLLAVFGFAGAALMLLAQHKFSKRKAGA